MNSFYSDQELRQLGFNAVGDNVLISKKCSFYNISEMSIGNNVRIDDFCILSGEITIGDYVHISAYVALYGKAGITIGNYSNISPRSTVFSVTDDFGGDYMISPIAPQELCNTQCAEVILEQYVSICAHSVVMPGVQLKEGTVIGAQSLVKSNTESWSIYAGVPCRFLKTRSNKIIKLALSK